MDKGLKFAKNVFSLLIREALNKGALFILLIFIGRYFGKEDLGRYTLAIAMSQIFFLGAELGLNTLVIREVAKDKLLAGKALFNIGILRIILGLAAVGLIWLTALLIGARGETIAVVFLCAASYFFTNITSLYTSIFRAFEKMELELFVVLVKNIIFLPVAIWMIFNRIGLAWIFCAFLASNVAALAAAHVIFSRRVASLQNVFDFSFLKIQLRESLPFWISQLFGMAYLKVSSLLLFKMGGERAVGAYNAGSVVVEGFWIASACFVSSIFPIMSRLGAMDLPEFKREYLNGLRYIAIIFIPLGLGIMLGAAPIVNFLYGGNFLEIAPLLRLLAFAAILIAFDTHNGLSIVAMGKQSVLPIVYGAAFLINFVLCIVLIPRFDYLGAGYALVICEASSFILMMAVLRRAVLKTSIQ